MDGHEPIVFAYGVREVVNGIGILASDDPTPWVWGRVGGDALDIATVAAGMSGDNPRIGTPPWRSSRCSGSRRPTSTAPAAWARSASAGRADPGLPRPHRLPAAGPGGARRRARRGVRDPHDFRGPPALRPYQDGTAPLSTAAAHA